MRKQAERQGGRLSTPQAQRKAPALLTMAGRHRERNDAVVAAYASGAYSYHEIAECFDLHLATIGRIIRG